MWARAQALDQQRCHGAASAAVKAERAGTDPSHDAVEGAQRAHREEIDPSVRLRELGNWYAWAIEDQKLAADLALDVARAAATSVVRGMSQTQALDVALAYSRGQHVRMGPPITDRLLRDPGCFPLAAAVVILVLALVSGLPGFFLILAFLSFVVPLRAARFRSVFTWMMGAALLVDVATIVIIAFGFKA